MPRDSKGNVFGIGSTVRQLDGGLSYKVTGFLVTDHVITRAQSRQVAALVNGRPTAYVNYWHEVEVTDPGPLAEGFASHTDTCAIDIAQAKGLQLPPTRAGVRSAIRSQLPDDGGDKVVWNV
jgi:hypothetical protein